MRNSKAFCYISCRFSYFQSDWLSKEISPRVMDFQLILNERLMAGNLFANVLNRALILELIKIILLCF